MSPGVVAQRDFPPHPESLAAVRRCIVDILGGLAAVEDIVLATSELASNVVKHARTAYTVRADLSGNRVRLEVSDGSSVIPAVEELAESKRGLCVIEALSDDWGVDLTETGKTVWVEFRPRTRQSNCPTLATGRCGVALAAAGRE